MKTYLANVDIKQPIANQWGTQGYTTARLLVRSGSRPLDEIHVPLKASKPALAAKELKPWLEGYLPIRTRAYKAERVYLPSISVIVCTRDRPKSLRGCLESLSLVRHPEMEVIVVDNASETDETRKVVAQTGFRYVRENRPGLDWARNRGWCEARHPLVAYIDDDASADECWLEGLCRGFRDPEIAATTGLVLPAELETKAQHLFESYGSGMSKGMSARQFRSDEMASVEFIRSQDVGVGTNMAFRRSVLQNLGGFDTALDVGTPSGGGGDLDMLHRVLASGGNIAYEPSALVRHRHRRDMDGLVRQMRNNGRSYGVYLMKLWRNGDVSKAALLRFTLWTWGRWLVGRPVKKLFGRHRLPMNMLIAELRGALSAPGAYRQTYKNDLRIRREFDAPAMGGGTADE
ncbi:MAG: glycosyltransferase [Gammaproteobacteria bacterium]